MGLAGSEKLVRTAVPGDETRGMDEVHSHENPDKPLSLSNDFGHSHYLKIVLVNSTM